MNATLLGGLMKNAENILKRFDYLVSVQWRKGGDLNPDTTLDGERISNPLQYQLCLPLRIINNYI